MKKKGKIKKPFYVNWNGKLVDKMPLKLSNRSFLYGDGLFESIRIISKKCPFLPLHFKRLLEGAASLQLEIPENFDLVFLKKAIEKLIQKNEIDHSGVLRLTLFRDSTGNYLPKNNKIQFLITAKSIKNQNFKLNKKGLTLGKSDQYFKNELFLSQVKSNNALLYVLANLEAKKHHWDEIILPNSKGNFAECSASNLFLIQDKKLITPPLSDGALPGTMRSIISTIVLWQDLEFIEQSIQEKDLLEADEIFLTNAIKGIQWVGNFQNKKYQNTQTKLLSEALNEYISGFFYG